MVIYSPVYPRTRRISKDDDPKMSRGSGRVSPMMSGGSRRFRELLTWAVRIETG